MDFSWCLPPTLPAYQKNHSVWLENDDHKPLTPEQCHEDGTANSALTAANISFAGFIEIFGDS
jgi:hypothetical protein